MDGDDDGNAEPATQVVVGVCIWCHERIDDPADREVHVSLLGVPAEFHRACFEDYDSSEH